jgi:hypothetical protein
MKTPRSATRLDAGGWRLMFEMGADNPQAWRVSAENLLRGSRAVGREVRVSGTLIDVIVSVQAMLVGMSIECSLKALWLKQDRRYARAGTGFLRDGKLQLAAMKGAAKHDLRMMATVVGVVDVAELELLERLSWFVLWAGRYPVPGTADQMVPKHFKKSGQVIPRVIRVEDLVTADALAVRLLDEATPWT